jgi:hypothetical protein
MVRSTSPLADLLGEEFHLTAVEGGTQLDWLMVARLTGLGRVLFSPTRALLVSLLNRSGRNLKALLRAC